MRFTSLLFLLWATICQGQTVNTNDPLFEPRWVTVPSPIQAPTLVLDSTGIHPATFPLGNIEVAYTLVDQFDRHTAMSPATTINPQANWQLVVNPVGLDKNTPAVATAWWWKDNGIWRVLGAGRFCSNPKDCTRPYLPITGWQQNKYQGHLLELTVFKDWNFNALQWWPEWSDAFWLKGSAITPPAVAPECRVYDKRLPKTSCKVAYSWACNEGESPLSGVVTLPAVDGRVAVTLARKVIPPHGACGMYVYVSSGTTNTKSAWNRQPAPHVVSPNPANKDDYLWRLDSNVIILEQFHETGIKPGTPGRSWLTSIQLAIDGLNGSNANIQVTEDQEIFCPIIMPLSNGLGNSMGRTISAVNGGAWKLTTTIKTGSPKSWPMWLENSQFTRLVGCSMISDTAHAGVAFLDHAGSGAFHFTTERLTVAVSAPNAAGIIVTQDSAVAVNFFGAVLYGHSGSETDLDRTVIGAPRPVVIEGIQSANWTFNMLTATANSGYDTAIITLSNSGFVTIRGRLTCDGARAIVAATSATQIDIENIFADTGFPEWFVCGYRTVPRINASIKGMNIRCGFIHYATQTSPGNGMMTVTFTGSNSEPCTDVCNFTTRYNGISFTGTPSNSSKSLVVRQPLLANWQNTRYWLEWDGGETPVTPPPVVVP